MRMAIYYFFLPFFYLPSWSHSINNSYTITEREHSITHLELQLKPDYSTRLRRPWQNPVIFTISPILFHFSSKLFCLYSLIICLFVIMFCCYWLNLYMLSYCIRVCSDVVKNRDFRGAVLRIIVKLYKQHADPDYSRIVECLIFLDDSAAVVDVFSPSILSYLSYVIILYIWMRTGVLMFFLDFGFIGQSGGRFHIVGLPNCIWLVQQQHTTVPSQCS